MQTTKQYRASILEMFEDYTSTHPVVQEAELIARQDDKDRRERRASRRESVAARDLQLGASAQKLDPNKRRSTLQTVNERNLQGIPKRLGRRNTQGESIPEEKLAPPNDDERHESSSQRKLVPPRSAGSMLRPPGEKEDPLMDQHAGGLPALDTEDEAASTTSSTATTPRPMTASRNGSVGSVSHRASMARLSVPALDLSSITGNPPKVSASAKVDSTHADANGARPAVAKHTANHTQAVAHSKIEAHDHAASGQKANSSMPREYTPNEYTPHGMNHTSEVKPTSYQVSGGCGDLQAGLENLADELRMNRPTQLGHAPNTLKEIQTTEGDDENQVKSNLRENRYPPQPLDPPISMTTQETPLGDGFSLVTEVSEYADGQKRRGSTWLKVDGQPPVMLDKKFAETSNQERRQRRRQNKDEDRSRPAPQPSSFARIGSHNRENKPVSNCSTLDLLSKAISIDDISLSKRALKEEPSIAQRQKSEGQIARHMETHVQLHSTLSNMAAKLAAGQLQSNPENPWVIAEQLRQERDAWRSETSMLKLQAIELQQKLVSAQQEARYWHQHPSARPYHSLKSFGQDVDSARTSMPMKTGEMADAAQTADALRHCLQKVQALKNELLTPSQENQHYPETLNALDDTEITQKRRMLHRSSTEFTMTHFPEMGGYAF
eukprot:gnl/MRDRNA2_/MRDRNA2_45325_c0_seq1.p1 gnl/MRDRNA2_/MRDRNA2_45325_c0~~gnl/MRDRNA2_/MRDRNA2_45325_c0_seq1.p1  ORF type:complete len:666 (-),score=133.13 gnl/MRDRNA2_/MRDRNA2_45325_c0_seq1:86-2083(-)